MSSLYVFPCPHCHGLHATLELDDVRADVEGIIENEMRKRDRDRARSYRVRGTVE